MVGPIEVAAAAGAIVAFDPVKRALGPTADYLGDQLRATVEKQWNRIVEKANKKISVEDEVKPSNLRVTAEILRSGTTIESEIAAEYLSGILAGSKSEGGSNDGGITYLSAIRALSSVQLQLHYSIYRATNQIFVSKWPATNLGQSQELVGKKIFLPGNHLMPLGFEPSRDLTALLREGVISEFKFDVHMLPEIKSALPFLSVGVTSYGFMLFAVAHNKEMKWKEQAKVDFGKLDSKFEPILFASTLEELVELVKKL